jgi:glycyl-tRNA synthetase beta chain
VFSSQFYPARAGKRRRSIAETVDQIVRGFPWPKSMRWGDGTLRWVRPIKRILCLFDGQVVPFEIDGIVSGDATEGHRFLGTGVRSKIRRFQRLPTAT